MAASSFSLLISCPAVCFAGNCLSSNLLHKKPGQKCKFNNLALAISFSNVISGEDAIGIKSWLLWKTCMRSKFVQDPSKLKHITVQVPSIVSDYRAQFVYQTHYWSAQMKHSVGRKLILRRKSLTWGNKPVNCDNKKTLLQCSLGFLGTRRTGHNMGYLWAEVALYSGSKLLQEKSLVLSRFMQREAACPRIPRMWNFYALQQCDFPYGTAPWKIQATQNAMKVTYESKVCVAEFRPFATPQTNDAGRSNVSRNKSEILPGKLVGTLDSHLLYKEH